MIFECSLNTHDSSLEHVLSMNVFDTVINKHEIDFLYNLNKTCSVLHSTIDFGYDHYQYLLFRKARRGEVVFLLENIHKKALLHTKPHYPNNVYRLLTGGINHGEDVTDCLEREVFEETGFSCENPQFIGFIFYEIKHENITMPFVSYLFRINNISGEPSIQDKTENISGFLWSSWDELPEIYSSLLNVPDDWKDWGYMRAIPHKVFYENNNH